MPLSALMVNLPESESEIYDELLEARFPTTKRDDVTPNDLRMYGERLNEYAKKVFAEFIDLSREIGYEDKVVTVLDTKFNPSSCQKDFMEGKLDGLVTYPHLLSYLMYKEAISGNWFSSQFYTIFTSSRISHCRIVHESNGAKLHIEAEHGYDCHVSFATIL